MDDVHGRGVPKSAPQATALYGRAIALGETACRSHEPRAARTWSSWASRTSRETARARTRRKRCSCFRRRATAVRRRDAPCSARNTRPVARFPTRPSRKDLSRAATLYERGCPARAVPAESDDPAVATIVASGRAHACGNLGALYEIWNGCRTGPDSRADVLISARATRRRPRAWSSETAESV